MRGGTHAMHDIVGFGKACEIAKRDLAIICKHIKQIESEFFQVLNENACNYSLIGSNTKKIPGLLNLSIPGTNNEIFCKQVSDKISISTGSACSINEKSYVLEAMNIFVNDNIRISFSKFTTNPIDIALNLIKQL